MEAVGMIGIRQSDCAFGLTFATVFAGIAGVGWLVFDAVLYWAMVASAVFLVIALALPGILLPFNRLWAVFAHRLGRVNNYVLLGLFFYLIVCPAGLVGRLLGWDPMHRVVRPKANSYWTPVKRQTDAETFRDMF